MSHIEIDARSQVPIYEQIMDRIRALVRSGALRPETSLPSVRQLAQDLDINANTVAKAYSLLERQGVVRTARRRGTVIAPAAPRLARESTAERLERAVDRLLEEAASLGVDCAGVAKVVKERCRQLGGTQRRSP